MFKSFASTTETAFHGQATRSRPVQNRSGTVSILRPRADSRAIRAVDVIVALLALALFAPLMLAVALMIRVASPGPVIFVQRRIGRNGRTFRCFKFRTMATDAERRLAELLAHDPIARAEWALDHKLRNDPRIIPGGNLLRKASFDELPQLFNVLRGDMSIVGPRPIVESEVERYGRYFISYCAVRPGLTGLWQISGRNDVSYRRRVACDVLYSRAKSLSTDIRIIAATVPAVLLAKGSY